MLFEVEKERVNNRLNVFGMNFKQKLSILFYLKGSKKSCDGKVPIYIRITIDGMAEDLSLGVKVLEVDWDSENKIVRATDRSSKIINKKIGQAKADLERHFDLMAAKNGIVTPAMLKASYRTPINGQQLKLEKVQSLAFSEKLDALIKDYIEYCSRVEKANQFDATPSLEKQFLFDRHHDELKKAIEDVVKEANTIFDNKGHHKTLVLAINEYLLNFLQLAFTGHRSPNSLEKIIGRKRRYLDFISYRYKVADLPLHQLEYKFITDLFNYLLTHHGVNENTATKYCQCIKEIADRAVANGWLPTNLFSLFKCNYREPEKTWLSMEEFECLKDHVFKNKRLGELRHIYMFCGLTGLSYQEVYDLGPRDLIKESDGEIWISKKRQKTGGDESVPLLPLALEILELYKDHPVCVRRNRLLPVPTNQTYNKGLKEISEETGIQVLDHGHQMRYFFANEIAFNNGVDLKTVSKMLSHKSIKTTEIYVKPNKRNISENMKMVKQKMFNEDGSMKSGKAANQEEEQVITVKLPDPYNPLRVVHIAKN